MLVCTDAMQVCFTQASTSTLKYSNTLSGKCSLVYVLSYLSYRNRFGTSEAGKSCVEVISALGFHASFNLASSLIKTNKFRCYVTSVKAVSQISWFHSEILPVTRCSSFAADFKTNFIKHAKNRKLSKPRRNIGENSLLIGFMSFIDMEMIERRLRCELSSSSVW